MVYFIFALPLTPPPFFLVLKKGRKGELERSVLARNSLNKSMSYPHF